MMRKETKRLVKFLECNGFEYASTNAKGAERYTRPGFADVAVSVSVDEFTVTKIIRNLQKDMGVATIKDQRKRDAGHIKERQASAREQAAAATERLDLERAEIEARLAGMESRQFGGLIVEGTAADVEALRRRLMAIEDDRRYYQKVMTDVPSVNAHSGRADASHRS
jgi:hypothetical protein